MTNHRPISSLVLHDDVHGVVDNKSNERREARFARYAQRLCPRSWVVVLLSFLVSYTARAVCITILGAHCSAHT